MPRLLSIAVDTYPESDRQLRGAINDSRAWTGWFARRGWQTESLWNEQATGARIRAAIERLIGSVKPGDRLALHFSGHGSQLVDESGDERDRFDECYCPWDVATHGPLRDDQLYQLFQLRPEGVRLYLIADCCHSGSLHRGPDQRAEAVSLADEGNLPGKSARWSGNESLRIEPVVRYLPLGRAAGAERRTSLPAVARTAGLLLAACGESERAREITLAGETRGAFTHTALRVLEQLPPGCSHRHWFAAVNHAIRRLPLNQTPRLVGSAALSDEPVFGEVW